MQFLDLKAQYHSLKKEIDQAVLQTLEGGVFIGGKEVESLEKTAAESINTKFAISVNSGTDALYLSLKVLGIGPGDEVITTPFTFIATAEVVAACGAKPVFVDIDPATFNIDPEKIEAAITPKTKAILPVHLYGQMAEMEKICGIAKKHNLKIIEDCAQSMGASLAVDGKITNAGSAGDAGCFSFFPSKTLGAFGDGGMVATNDERLANDLKILKSHGSSPENKYCNLKLGVNSRLDGIQAAILNVKIKYLAGWNRKRAELADHYNKAFAGINDLLTPFVANGNTHVYHQYTVRTAKRGQLQECLRSKGIPTMIYYPIPLHLQPAFEYLGHKIGDFPEAERAAQEVLSLPIYPEFGQESQDAVIKAIKEFYVE